MTTSLYNPYRERLAQLANGDGILAALRQAGFQQAWWAETQAWQPVYGRFNPQQAPYASLLYETSTAPQALCLVEVSDELPATVVGEWQTVLPDKRFGYLCLTRFPYEPALPGLSSLLTEHAHIKVLRYRPGKRCTLRVNGSANTPPSFAKLFTDNRGQVIHDESLALWQASADGQLDFAVAQPLRWDSDKRTLWQGCVAGQPIVDELLTDAGIALAGHIGRATASLTLSKLKPQLRFDWQAQMKRSQKYSRVLGQRVPHLKPQLQWLLDKLTQLGEAIGDRQLYPIHGAPHAHQWLAQTGGNGNIRLGLVDFDRLSMGDRELDAATFITEMDFEDWNIVPGAAINHAFLSGYEAITGKLHPQLLAGYCVHKRLAKAHKAAHAVRPDGDFRAERNLGRAIELARLL